MKAEIAKLEEPEGLIHPADNSSTGNEAQDSHSRTILAALMSGDVDEAFEAGPDDMETSWMQGVEDMFKEAEGRLSELAAVAAAGPARNGADGQQGEHGGDADANIDAQGAANGQMDGNGQQGGMAGEGGEGSSDDPHHHSQPDGNAQQSGQELHHDESHPSSRQGEITGPRKFIYNPSAAAAAAASTMAVALNAEMEKALRDDLALTKAAIAKVDREIAYVKSLIDDGRPVGDAPERDADRRTCLPDILLSDDKEAIQLDLDEKQKEINKLHEVLPDLRERVIKAKDSKLEEEDKLAAIVLELQSSALPDNEEDRERIATILKAVGGFVGGLLSGGHFEVSKLSSPINHTSSVY